MEQLIKRSKQTNARNMKGNNAFKGSRKNTIGGLRGTLQIYTDALMQQFAHVRAHVRAHPRTQILQTSFSFQSNLYPQDFLLGFSPMVGFGRFGGLHQARSSSGIFTEAFSHDQCMSAYSMLVRFPIPLATGSGLGNLTNSRYTLLSISSNHH